MSTNAISSPFVRAFKAEANEVAGTATVSADSLNQSPFGSPMLEPKESGKFNLALEKLSELYTIYDWFFTANPEIKIEKLQGKIDEIDEYLKPHMEKNKAIVQYIRGKSFNCLKKYAAEAETCLREATELDPTNSSAWCALGVCVWKKGDKELARKCFLTSIECEENKENLLELSMLSRQMPEEKRTNISQSVDLAKRAISLDLSDHKSWYIMGNAWCASFFYSHTVTDIQKALSAYKRSESLGGAIVNPDLHCNKGNLLRYLQDYVSALHCYRLAQSIDPCLEGIDELIQSTEMFLGKVIELTESGGHMKKRKALEAARHLQEYSARVNEAVKSASAADPSSPIVAVANAVSELQKGVNIGKFLALKVNRGNSR